MTYGTKYPSAPRKRLDKLVFLAHKMALWAKIVITFVFFVLVAIIIITYAGFTAIFFAFACLIGGLIRAWQALLRNFYPRTV